MHTLRLHFTEDTYAAVGERVFTVTVNSSNEILTDFDIYKSTGAQHKAIIEQFNVPADANGNIAVQFITTVGSAKVDGIEIM
jgi:hypothetical protein